MSWGRFRELTFDQGILDEEKTGGGGQNFIRDDTMCIKNGACTEKSAKITSIHVTLGKKLKLFQLKVKD